MSNIQRLKKCLSRQGIKVKYQNQIYRLKSAHCSASVLLPETFKLEEKAVKQLLQFAGVQIPGTSGHVCQACATSDFHPGSIPPVGSIVATTPDMVIPAAIGTDINCGMRLIKTGIPLQQGLEKQRELEALLTAVLLQDQRNVPVRGRSFAALFDDSPNAWLHALKPSGIWEQADFQRLERELQATLGLFEIQAHSRYAPEAFFEDRVYIRPASLGTTGSGNHFVEIQVVDKILDRHAAYHAGLKAGELVVMIHSGSRNVGFYVGGRWMDKAKAAWPAQDKHPESGLYGLSGPLVSEHLLAMGLAARYAWANRVVLSELIRSVWLQTFQEDNTQLVVDIPHNIVLQNQGMNIQRKGATPVYEDKLALIPGSMGNYSYLVMGKGNAHWLWSCSHGAGRTVRRQQMRAKEALLMKNDHLPWHCVTLNEARKVEEAPGAYKPVGPVIEAQENAQMIQSVARLRPWITFKA